MSAIRELIKYVKHPLKILPRLRDQVRYPLNRALARAWVRIRGREALRLDSPVFLYGGFGGRRYGDNGAAFFESMLQNHPEVESFWVIRKDCCPGRPGRRPIPDPSRILFRGTFRANVLTLVADALIFSHGRYDITDYAVAETPEALNVMLDHGITGLKREGRVAGTSMELDLIASSSRGEAEIHEKEWGIPPGKIAITGLARHDRLLSRKKIPSGRGADILFMPTWREWNSRKVSLTRTGFFSEIRSFLLDPELAEILDRRRIRLRLYVHMWMREFFEEFRREFEAGPIEVLDQEIDLQEVLLGSSLLITDYSSISWDFLLLDKPVLFYQFDLDDYLQRTGAYLDLEKNLFGPVALTANEAVYWVRYFVENDFSTVPFTDAMERAKKFAFAYRDGKNCERLAEEILKRKSLGRESAAGSPQAASPLVEPGSLGAATQEAVRRSFGFPNPASGGKTPIDPESSLAPIHTAARFPPSRSRSFPANRATEHFPS